ncbi:hypothetical protein D3C84_1270400 [compost metagenome]
MIVDEEEGNWVAGRLVFGSSGRSRFRSAPFEVIKARSMTFCSSRIFPSQE